METTHIPLFILLFVVIKLVVTSVRKDSEDGADYISKLTEIEKQFIGYTESCDERNLWLDLCDDNALRRYVYGKRPPQKHGLKYSDLWRDLTI